MNELKEGVDFSFDLSEGLGNNVRIKLLHGDFSGVVYSYGKVSVEEDEENDRAYLNFDFDIDDNNDIEGIEKNIDFKNHIGDILTSIVLSQAVKSEGAIFNEPGNLDT
jgi:hypothetical protein